MDSKGAVYVTDSWATNHVLTLPAGSTTQTVLPFTGLLSTSLWGGVAVDSNGSVYVADAAHNRVLSLPAGSTTQTVLPFTGLDDPLGVAVDSKGAVYVADSGNDRVLTLPAGSTTQTVLPFIGDPHGVAVDSAGNVYVTAGEVLKLPRPNTVASR